MPRSLKVSPDLIGTVKLALKQQGLLSQRALSEELSVALSTVSNFFNGKPVDRAIFEEICAKLALPWKEVAAFQEEAIAPPADESPLRLQDWGEAPQVNSFYGRTDELAQLEGWICSDRCRLVMVLGMGGVGKTTLAVRLAEQIQERFEGFVWRSLRNLPPIETLLKNLLQTLAHPNQIAIPNELAEQINLLMELLRDRRYLLILDNAESLLQGGERVGYYREGYSDYEELFNRIAHGRHQSCLVVTSREKLGQLAIQDDEAGPTRSLQLGGLSPSDGQQILKAKGLKVDSFEIAQLLDNYRGNPLALKIAAATIRATFDGDITRFQQQDIGAYGGIWELLKQQCDRLSPLEQAVMDWLAVEREWVSFSDLQKNWIAPIPQRSLLEALESLQGRSLIEVSSLGYTQQPVVMEYMTQTLIDRCHDEITNQNLDVFRSHALFKAQTPDYIRDAQARFILQPLIQQLLATLKDSVTLEFFLNQILNALRGKPLSYTGYAAGNTINLLNIWRSHLNGYNFSELAIAQAFFTNTTLQNTNFRGSTLYQSTFAEVFGGVIAVAFSADGKYVAISDARAEIHVWNLLMEQKLLTLRGHKSWVFSFVFSLSSKTLASASDDYVVKLWEIESGQCLQTLKGPANLLHALTFSPDEQRILYHEAAIQLWNVDHPDRQIAALQGNTLLARATAYSPDGQAIAVSSRDQTIKLWNVQTGECIQTLSGHTADVRMLRFSASGRYLASTSLDLSIRLWDLASGQCMHVLQGHTQGVSETAFSPDEHYLASSSFDRTLKLWDVTTGQCLKTLYGHQKYLTACAFSPDGQFLLSGGGDHAVKFWDVKTGQCLRTVQGYANAVKRIALAAPHATPDHSNYPLLASTHEDKTVKLWNLKTGQILKTLPPQTDLTWGLAFSPDASLLATASSDHTVKLWNWQTGECLQTLQHRNWGWAVAFHPSGFPLVTGSYDQTIKIWNPNTGECLQTLNGHISPVLSVAYSPDGNTLASSSHDRTIRLWNPETGECLRVLEGHRDRIWQAKFSPDGQFLVSCGYDETIRFWDPQTGNCFRTLHGHQGAITSLCFSPDGQHLVSGSFDRTIRIWDVNTGECLRTLWGHDNGILSLLYEPVPLLVDGDNTLPLILSSSFDGTIKIWHPKTGTCLQSLIAPRPYDGMNISEVWGLTAAQEANLKLLGAIATEC